MKNNMIIIMVLASFIQSACRHPEIKKKFPEPNIVEPNSEFRVNLPEDHRTGYLWQIGPHYDTDVVIRLNEVWHGNEKGIDFNLKSRSTGQTTLTFVKRKYTDTSDIQQFVVKIGHH